MTFVENSVKPSKQNEQPAESQKPSTKASPKLRPLSPRNQEAADLILKTLRELRPEDR